MAKFVLAIFARPLRSRGYRGGSKRFLWATACKDPSLIHIIAPAIIYVNVVFPAKAGIQNEFDWMPDQVRHDD